MVSLYTLYFILQNTSATHLGDTSSSYFQKINKVTTEIKIE